VLAAGLLIAALASCNTHPRPWEGGDAAAPTVGGAPPGMAPSPDGGSLLSEAPTLLESADDAGPPPSPVRVGGPWVRCFGNFRPSGEPLKDVTRLALLCGPSNGMVRADGTEGAVAAGHPPVSWQLPAVRGECYRVFAVAEASVEDLDVVVRSSRGATIAADHGDDAWPVVQPDRPFCALEDDTVSVEVSTRRGSGKFAAEAWKLASRAP
jgi:hypothetical protein